MERDLGRGGLRGDWRTCALRIQQAFCQPVTGEGPSVKADNHQKEAKPSPACSAWGPSEWLSG